ncbi:efflux transporter, RND family, MFP subunit [Ancylobacter novellus DSM 506]|uniref:Efflux transporter, RND family, MFP subunit n=1 Tax=Ancylobacter novellus (strain ATCC 8093 / DSM 506 / JCM 20403 / CCM 1077 / IAM 12100 / NBRC 12443 / NCIMB 10456) TaxID=639283 RepID=D7A356_ANCN5|nr:efflux RND transporter periplasmic adaptor subunit [Ancylobacter novellus]ADH87774.1 efflux transporter, RND family, MFP subunit [Ancylobacter novellus DSM 506]
MSNDNLGNDAGSSQIVHVEIARDVASQHKRHRWREAGVVLTLAALATGAAVFLAWPSSNALATDPAPAAAAPPAMPVAVAVLEPRDTMKWDEFSGRLQAVERVEVRPRVAGAVKTIHFREGALVKQGELLVTIDPEPFQAELDRAEAQSAAAEARLLFTKNELDRGQKLVDSRVVSVQDLDQRTNNYKEAQANLRAAQADVQTAKLDLGYTEVRAPVDGRVGRIDVTVGNLVSAGPTSPVLTTLVSVDPIYVGFAADEGAVSEALATLGNGDVLGEIDRIPVEITTATTGEKPARGHLQLVDNQVDTATGTFRLRAVFDNPDGRLVPGQFARVRMGRAKTEPALVINERAIGTDQDKKYVFVVDPENKAVYREVKLGPPSEGLRVVASGLKEGERIVVNGLQRVRPGALLAPEIVPMNTTASAANPNTSVAAR